MDIGQIPLMAAMRSQMLYTGARQAVIAQNIANADTPGYVSHDLKAPSFSDMLAGTGGPKRVTLAQTSPMHLSGNAYSAGAYKVIDRDPTAETNPNGNKVSIEQEVEKMSMNQDDYEQAVLLFKANMTMFNTAVDKSAA